MSGRGRIEATHFWALPALTTARSEGRPRTAWLEPFRFIAEPAEFDIPISTVVYSVTTPEQRTSIRNEALHVMAQEEEIEQRAVKLRDGLTKEN